MEAPMKLTVVGCGDAFGSGGRLQTCYHIDNAGHQALIDCGTSTLIGLARAGLDPNDISTIFISHLHGDHFGGLVWWLLHAQHISKRKAPLEVAGPVDIESRFIAAAEALFPGSTRVKRRFDLIFHEYDRNGASSTVGPITVRPFEVRHPSGSPPYALRLDVGRRVVSFTGDTEWVESLVPAGKDADLYIMECFAYDKPAPYHLDWKVIEANLDRINTRRVLLTHMGPQMLASAPAFEALQDIVLAEDGLVLHI